MSTVTKVEFDALRKEIIEQLTVLNATINALVTEIRTSNVAICKDVEAIQDKIESLQNTRTEMWNIIHELKIKVYIAYAIPGILFGAYQLFKMMKP